RPRVEQDAILHVAGDEVARRGRGPADRVAGGTVGDAHAAQVVGQGGRAGGVGAEVVALHQVPCGAVAGDFQPVLLVARQEVARPGGRAADEVAGSAVGDRDAAQAVAHLGGPGGVGGAEGILHAATHDTFSTVW